MSDGSRVHTPPFGFSARRVRYYTGGWDARRTYDEPYQPVETHLYEPPVWRVYLPHKCDDWDIVGDQYDRADGPGHAQAITELERFIAEAQHVLAELRAGREVDGEALVDDYDPEATS